MEIDCTIHDSSLGLYFFLHGELRTLRRTDVLGVFEAAEEIGRTFVLRGRFVIEWMEASVVHP
jgi:hypothetical protein